MKLTRKVKLIFKIAILCVALSQEALAQFVPAQPMVQLPGLPLWTVNAQVRTRTEYRHGLGNPYLKSANGEPAFFTSQRTNLNFGFRWDKMNFNADVRDVRVWGQDASTISNADGAKLFLHQAWGEFVLGTSADTNARFKFFDNLSLKIGRQELVYDDVRLLGNLDWLQQGRRHDAVVLKMLKRGFNLDYGLAMNQNTDAFNTTSNQYTSGNVPGTVLSSNRTWVSLPGANFIPLTTLNGSSINGALAPNNPPSTNGMNQNYKFMQFLYLTRKFNQTKFSFLALRDDFSRSRLDSIDYGAGGKVYGRRFDQGNKVYTRYTYGGQISTQGGNVSSLKWTLNAGAYVQTGKSKTFVNARSGEQRNLSAHHYFIYGLVSKGRFSAGPGYEKLSGNTNNITVSATGTAVSSTFTGDDQAFDPLYGTPHRWWGYMDYFYVGTGAPRAGLQDLYLRLRYDAKDLFITFDAHRFSAADKINLTTQGGKTETMNSLYGYELDLLVNYQFNRFCNLEAGASMFSSGKTLEASKLGTIDKTEDRNFWTYVQLNIRPDFLFQKPVPITN